MFYLIKSCLCSACGHNDFKTVSMVQRIVVLMRVKLVRESGLVLLGQVHFCVDYHE
jgi:hypothetical protein